MIGLVVSVVGGALLFGLFGLVTRGRRARGCGDECACGAWLAGCGPRRNGSESTHGDG